MLLTGSLTVMKQKLLTGYIIEFIYCNEAFKLLHLLVGSGLVARKQLQEKLLFVLVHPDYTSDALSFYK